MPPILDARDLVKQYRRTRAVDGVSLSVQPGERVGLLGPNGAGKTTTLLMLLGAVLPDEGSVQIAGHHRPHGRGRAMASVGFAAGYLPLTERLRVREFLTLYARLYGVVDARARVAEALDRFGVAELSDAMGTELSSGQRTLVGIAKATLHRPRLLVLDEPTASLDPEIAARARQTLLDISARDGTALLVTSHNMVEVERLCERVIFIARGRIVADGSPGDVMARFGRGDLEGVFLHLAGEARGVEASVAHDQTDRPA